MIASARRGPVVAGTWLIGIGLVFIVRQAMGLGWDEAWPLFVILVGVAGLVTTAINGVRGVAGLWSFTWPVVWIVVGVALFASTTGRLNQAPLDLIAQWWPVLLVVVGAWFVVGAIVPTGRAADQLAIPLAGATSASVRIRFGAGELFAGRASAGNLVDGTFGGGVVHQTLGGGAVELRQDTTYGVPWLDHDARWDVGLTADVPLDLRLDVGAARSALDLSELRLRSLELHTGASETRVRLPHAAGETSVRAETGAASLTIEVPTSVAARIRSQVALGRITVDDRFPRSTDGYASADYASATNRVDIEIRGGVGSTRIVSVP